MRGLIIEVRALDWTLDVRGLASPNDVVLCYAMLCNVKNNTSRCRAVLFCMMGCTLEEGPSLQALGFCAVLRQDCAARVMYRYVI